MIWIHIKKQMCFFSSDCSWYAIAITEQQQKKSKVNCGTLNQWKWWKGSIFKQWRVTDSMLQQEEWSLKEGVCNYGMVEKLKISNVLFPSNHSITEVSFSWLHYHACEDQRMWQMYMCVCRGVCAPSHEHWISWPW